MHIARIELEHIRSFDKLVWEQPEDNLAGWHVIIGDNASGKTTFLRAVALSLMATDQITALRFDFSSMLSFGKPEGHVSLRVQRRMIGGLDTTDPPIQPEMELAWRIGRDGSFGGGGRWLQTGREVAGFFSASFGPMRRFSGGDKELEKLFETNPRVAAHLSLFGEDVALTEVSRWLETLRFEQLEQNGEHPFLENLIAFINQRDLLPHGTKLVEISSKGVFFKDGRGVKVELEDLSDGFRSILCLTLELVRQMSVIFQSEIFETHEDGSVIIKPSGVVLIDEVDAHLHPTWQQRVGDWFVRHFPNLQFIVTTHSPLVCQAAATGSIFRLASPDEPTDASRFMEGEERKRLIFGNVLDAYGTEAFGHVTTSEQARRLREELAALNTQKSISPTDDARRAEILALLPNTMTGESTDAFLDGLLDALPPMPGTLEDEDA